MGDKRRERKKIISQLIKEGAQIVENLVVEKIVIRDLGNYIRLAIKFDKPIEQIYPIETGDYVKGQRDWVMSSLFDMANYIGDNENAAFLKNIIMQSPKLIHSLIERSEVDVLLEYVVTGQEWTNPFSKRQDSIVIEHDDIITHIKDIRLSQFAIKILDKFADKMIDAMMDDNYHNRTYLTDDEIDLIMYNDYNNHHMPNPFTVDEAKIDSLDRRRFRQRS